MTDDFKSDIQIVVNLTDYRNVLGARVDVPAGTALSTEFAVTKRSTNHYAYADRVDTQALEDLLGDLRAKTLGCCDQLWLDLFRLELFESEDTPPRVLTFCEDLDWGLGA